MFYKIVFAFFCLYIVILCKVASNQKEAFFENQENVEIKLDYSTKPSVTMESIHLAMMAFGIESPAGMDGPYLVKEGLIENGYYRGLTVAEGWKPTAVYIYESAFESWGLLGSTLAHEIEVHYNQRFLFAKFMGLITLSDKWENLLEAEAYNHEVVNQERFGLTISEVFRIKETQKLSGYALEDINPKNIWPLYKATMSATVRKK